MDSRKAAGADGRADGRPWDRRTCDRADVRENYALRLQRHGAPLDPAEGGRRQHPLGEARTPGHDHWGGERDRYKTTSNMVAAMPVIRLGAALS